MARRSCLCYSKVIDGPIEEPHASCLVNTILCRLVPARVETAAPSVVAMTLDLTAAAHWMLFDVVLGEVVTARENLS